jgi:hypothetical protein
MCSRRLAWDLIKEKIKETGRGSAISRWSRGLHCSTEVVMSRAQKPLAGFLIRPSSRGERYPPHHGFALVGGCVNAGQSNWNAGGTHAVGVNPRGQ